MNLAAEGEPLSPREPMGTELADKAVRAPGVTVPIRDSEIVETPTEPERRLGAAFAGATRKARHRPALHPPWFRGLKHEVPFRRNLSAFLRRSFPCFAAASASKFSHHRQVIAEGKRAFVRRIRAEVALEQHPG